MCGIVGVFKPDEAVVAEVYNGLLMLQHRGQDAAGIVTYDQSFFHEKRGKGLVSEVLEQSDIEYLKGNIGLGHCRYPTAGSLSPNEAQPFFVNAPLGIYLIHNGNLTNTDELRTKVQKKYHRHLRTQSDTEVLLNVFAEKLAEVMKEDKQCSAHWPKCVFNGITRTMQQLQGAYSIICIIDQIGLCAFRDPYGIRPLIWGKKETTKGTEYMFASEDVALKSQGFEVIRDVNPGEAIIITKDQKVYEHQCVPGTLRPCIFEFVYFARPDSLIDGISVYKSRLRMGASLARQIADSGIADQIDAVMPIPDSGRAIAIQIAEELGIKYREGLIKNRYIGRTFIMPGQSIRQKSIRRKLSPVELEFRGKNILLVDDSIVRGNTMKEIVTMCRAAGAKKIFVASGAPAVINPDVYGIDMPTRSELIAHNMTTEEVAKVLDIDLLFYQTVEDLIEACHMGNPKVTAFHTGVFDGNYPTPEVTEEYLNQVEINGRGKQQSKSEQQLSSLTL